MASIAKCRGLAGWWGPMKTLLHPEFLEAVERLMESPEGPPAYDELVPWFGETEAMAS